MKNPTIFRGRSFLGQMVILCFLFSVLSSLSFAQEAKDSLRIELDLASPAVPVPKVYKPGMDLGGRGFSYQSGWPQALASKEALANWQAQIGFSGIYRLQYDLWEINQLSKEKDLKGVLLSNYEGIIKAITDSGGIVILDIFGTPAGLGKILDKRSPPWDPKAFKALVKELARDLSCNKKYNIWYEVWNAPDLADFFLGSKQEYLNLYRAVAEGIKELEEEYGLNIPVGGPSLSWWFQNLEGNTVLTAEKSLIYELIKFCYQYRLPLDFISWHGYSTDPLAESASTVYKKDAITLIRDWLSYFHFERGLALIVDEWNYDRGANIIPERGEKSYIAASYIPARLRSMSEAGIDQQVYFSLEDFQNNKEGVSRNVGVFSFLADDKQYKSQAKATYNIFKMLNKLGSQMTKVPLKDEFVGAIATQSPDTTCVLIFNYIDANTFTNYITRNIAYLNASERKALLNIVNSQMHKKIASGEIDLGRLPTTQRVRQLLGQARQLDIQAKRFSLEPRSLKLEIKGLSGNFIYERYFVDSSCSTDCEFNPIEKKEISVSLLYEEELILQPYSVCLVVLKKKPEDTQDKPKLIQEDTAKDAAKKE